MTASGITLRSGVVVMAAGEPLGRGRLVVVLTHGRNAGPENILDLVPRLDRSGLTYLAPAAPDRTWYPKSFMAETRENEPSLSRALTVLPDLVEAVVARGIGRDRMVFIGFSQGACLTAESVVRHPARYGGVVIFTGGLIGPSGASWAYGGSFAGTPVFLGCSDVDGHVPVTRVHETAAVFTRMRAEVTTRIYPGMGHLVNEDEIGEAGKILDRALGDRPQPHSALDVTQ